MVKHHPECPSVDGERCRCRDILANLLAPRLQRLPWQTELDVFKAEVTAFVADVTRIHGFTPAYSIVTESGRYRIRWELP